MTVETLELLLGLLNSQQLNVGHPQFVEQVESIIKAKTELERALEEALRRENVQ